MYHDREGKRNNAVCCYQDIGEQRVGLIQKFVWCSARSCCMVILTPFEQHSSLLKSVGDPGRDILRQYADTDLLGVFIFSVKKDTLSMCIVPVTKLLCKCAMVSCSECN